MRQRSEVIGQKTEVRRQETEGRGQIEGWRVGGSQKTRKAKGSRSRVENVIHGYSW